MFFSLVVVSLLLVSEGAVSDLDPSTEGEDEMNFAVKYLTEFHYISPSNESGNHDVGEAVKTFQNFFHLPETGVVDEDTLNAMKRPRCGDQDVEEEESRFKRFDAVRSWSKTSFTYYVQYSGQDLSESDQQRAISEAFQKWKGACNVLNFARTTSPSNPDFKISFGGRTHAGIPGEQVDRATFDGRRGVVAHAYYPSDGRIHFDEDEKWSFSGRRGGWWLLRYTDAESMVWVATHEIGHALGLGHSTVRGTVMWPTVSLGNPTLHSDDVAGIRSLYRCK